MWKAFHTKHGKRKILQDCGEKEFLLQSREKLERKLKVRGAESKEK